MSTMGCRRFRVAAGLIGLGLLAGGLWGCTNGENPVAVLAAAVVTGPAPFDASFDISYTSHPLDRPMTFMLDFGDTSPIQSGSEFSIAIHHTYTEPGAYSATLCVTDDRGAMASDSVAITVDDSGPAVGIRVGETAPDFTAHRTDGGSFTLSSTRGSVVLLDFWGAWCSPCRITLEHLDDLVQTYASRGLVAVTVSTDLKEQDAVNYLDGTGLSRFISLWERGGKSGNPIAQLYNVSSGDVGIPRTYVIDRQGVIRFVGHPADLSPGFVEALL